MLPLLLLIFPTQINFTWNIEWGAMFTNELFSNDCQNASYIYLWGAVVYISSQPKVISSVLVQACRYRLRFGSTISNWSLNTFECLDRECAFFSATWHGLDVRLFLSLETALQNTNGASVFQTGLQQKNLSRHLVGWKWGIWLDRSNCTNQIYCNPNGSSLYTNQNDSPNKNLKEVLKPDLLDKKSEYEITKSSQNYANIFCTSAKAQVSASV